MIGITHFINFCLIGLQFGTMHNIIDPKPEKIFVIGNTRAKTGGSKSILHSFFHLCVNVRNGRIVEISADYGPVNA